VITTTGYWQEDSTMDGVVKYTGTDNDRDPILSNILSLSLFITASQFEQLP
jgi:hypothetical protein